MKCNLLEIFLRQESRITQYIFKLICTYYIAIGILPAEHVDAQSSTTTMSGATGNNVTIVPSVFYTFPASKSTGSPQTLATPSGDVMDNVTFVSEFSSSGNKTASISALPSTPFPTLYPPSTSFTTPFSMDVSAEAIVGIAIGCAVYIVLMILIVYIICWCTRRRRNSMSASRGLPVFPDPNLYGQQPPRPTNDGRKEEVGRYQRQLDEYSITDFVVVDVTPKNVVSRDVRSGGPGPAKISGIVHPPTRHQDVIPRGQRPTRRDQNILNRHAPRSPLERSDSFDY